MATSRRKISGFTTPKEEETREVEELLEESATEMFETISQAEPVVETKPVVVTAPFVEQKIVPTEDPGPRFVDKLPPATPAPSPRAAAPQLQPPPKRHPRNVPKFSRYK